ncbi:lysine histidine transporter 1-like [Solanum stenotomum]|uniref:lysine histidine transporter 1-like n=1 Tax=Solanum stenotomum TaxID=172797 RepID=UPI0020D15BF3|nr:lysine histidine transporter 1-like [Solanum stenotomum]
MRSPTNEATYINKGMQNGGVRHFTILQLWLEPVSSSFLMLCLTLDVTLQLAEGIQLSVELDVDYSYSAKINLGVVFDFFTLRDVAFAYGGYNVV